MKLEACNESKIDILRNKVSKHSEDKAPLSAILTQAITIKNNEDEEC
jgi:hypothetical protein